MGCWYATCGFSGLPIQEGEPVRAMYIVPAAKGWSNNVFSAFGLYVPATVLAKGTYNDYGGVEWYPGEEERLMKSAARAGIKLKPKNDPEDVVDYDDIEDDDNTNASTTSESVPSHCFWMMREDTFPVIDQLDCGSWREESIANKILELDAAVRKEIKIDQDERLFDHLLRSALERYRMTDVYEWKLWHRMYDDISYKGDISVLDDLNELFRVGYGMNSLRKVLTPMNGSGSQNWNETGYLAMAEHAKQVVKKRRDYYDEGSAD